VRHRRPAQTVAWVLTALAVLLLVPTLVLLGLNASHIDPDRILALAVLAGAAVVYAGAGRLITRRLPGNAIGWLLGLIGLSVAAATFTEQYALYGLVTARGSVLAARVAGVPGGGNCLAEDCAASSPHLAGPQRPAAFAARRPVLWAIFVVMAGRAAQLLQTGTKVTGGLVNALAAANVTYPNPLGVFPRTAGSAAPSR